MIKHVEIIVTSIEEAILAEKYGASRLELIHSFDLGGLSPRQDLIAEVCNSVSIPVNVMVRPHGDSFIFDNNNMLQVKKEIDYIIEKTKANAIVFGTLTDSGNINFSQLEEVLKQIDNTALELTFHRAIDVSNDAVMNCHKLVSQYNKSKLTRVLSSGGFDKAVNGVTQLLQMRKICDDYGIILLVGSGVTPDNAFALSQQIACDEIHLGTGVRKNGVLSNVLFSKLFTSIS
ncbi:MAG: copper homeostasis protein CutC [Burkholderiales bacterium]|nr:copper homeostasis protein CutC [Burkholderiales bacterium]